MSKLFKNTCIAIAVVFLISVIFITFAVRSNEVITEADWNGSITITLENGDQLNIFKDRIKITEFKPAKNSNVLEKYNNKNIVINLNAEELTVEFTPCPEPIAENEDL